MIVDMLKEYYKDKILDEKGAQGGRKRAKRKGRLVAVKVTNKKGYIQTVYIRPDKNKKGAIRTRSKHVNPHDVKFKDIVTGYIHSYERMLYKDYKRNRTFDREGNVFRGQNSNITNSVNRLLRKYGLPDKMNDVGAVRNKLLKIAADDGNFNKFLNDAKRVHTNLMGLEGRNNIRDRIDRNFSYIHKSLNDKKKKGALSTTIRNIHNGKQAGQYGVWLNRDKLANYNYHNVNSRGEVRASSLSPIKYNSKSIANLRKNQYYSKYNALSKKVNGRKVERANARRQLSKEYIPKTLNVRYKNRVHNFVNPLYVRVYGKRALRGIRH